MHRCALVSVSLFQLLGWLGQAKAGPIMISVNTTKADDNGVLNVATGFTIDTGTNAKPATSFKTPDGQTYNGRTVTQANGPSIVAFDLIGLSIQKNVDLSITGMNPIAFVTSEDINIFGNLDASGQPADGNNGGAGGAGGGSGGGASKDGSAAPGVNTGQGKAGGNNIIPGGGGGGGYGGRGGAGTTAGQAVGNTQGGAGGAAYGQSDLSVLLGGGGGGGAKGAMAAGGGGGGGAILLFSEGTMTISGSVSANGGRSSILNFSYGGGGGAGGSILLEDCRAGDIQLTGKVFARGGNGGDSTTMAGAGGGGGGGRVYIGDSTVELTRVFVDGGRGGDNSGAIKPENGTMGTKTLGMSEDCVPEPSSYVLLIAGIGILAGYRLKKGAPLPVLLVGGLRKSGRQVLPLRAQNEARPQGG